MPSSAPADGSTGNELIQAKGSPYTLQDLLIDPQLVQLYRDGQYVTLRLTPSMYHRFHAPHDCTVDKVAYVSGDTWNVNPIALKRIAKLFCKNERAVIRTVLRQSGDRDYPGTGGRDSGRQHPPAFSGRPVEHAVSRDSRDSLPSLLQQRAGNGMVPTRVDHHRFCTEGRRPLRIGTGTCGDPYGKAADAAAVLSGTSAMRILIATDAWSPQVNGVVQEPAVARRQCPEAGCRDRVSDAGRLSDLSVADLPEHSLRHPDLARNRAPDRACSTRCLHIATEGPIGHWCGAIASREKYLSRPAT